MKKPDYDALRKNIWRSLRILRSAGIADLCRTSFASRIFVGKTLRNLERHGIVKRQRSSRDAEPTFRIIKDLGPNYPYKCPACQGLITEPACRTLAPGEKKRKKEKKPNNSNDMTGAEWDGLSPDARKFVEGL